MPNDTTHAPHEHPENCEHECDHGHHHHHWWQKHWWKGFVGVTWGFAILVLTLSGLSIPLTALYVITGLTALLTLYLGAHIYASAFKELFINKPRKLSMNALYAISTITILVVSIAGFFFPWLPLMVEGAPLILGIFHIGEAIEHALKKKITSNLKITEQAPPTITKINEKGERVLNFSVADLVPNDEIEISPGQIIPVDGICLAKANIIPKAFSGSAFPKIFEANDAVKSGMRLPENASNLRIKVTHTFKDSYLSRLQNNIEEAQKQKAPIQNFTDTLFKYFVPTILTIAIVASFFIGYFFTIELALISLVALLVSPCPCTLKAITPLAVKIGMNKAANESIRYKNGAALQASKKIDRVVFDLDGTLNTDTGDVLNHQILDQEIEPNVFFQYVKLLEANNKDWIEKALYDFASKKITQDSKLDISDLDISKNNGVKAIIHHKTFIIGDEKMMRDAGITQIPDIKKANQPAHYIYIAREGEIIGTLTVANPLRHDARATIDALKNSGREVYICTGAHENTAKEYAKALGIPDDNVYANRNSDGRTKSSVIKTLQANGRYKVAMVGNTVNDLDGLKAADLSIVLGSSESTDELDKATQKHADVVIQDQSLMSVKTTLDIGQQTHKNISQNLFISLTYNTTITFVGATAIFIPLLGFVLNPVIGIALMVLETALVLTNILIFKNQTISPQPTVNPTPTYNWLCSCWPPQSNDVSEEPLLKNQKENPNSFQQENSRIQKSIVSQDSDLEKDNSSSHLREKVA